MTENDLDYVEMLIKCGIIKSPTLELGASYGGNTCKSVIEQANIAYDATDIYPSKGVKYVADFSDKVNVETVFDKKYASVLVLNILEHTFDPVEVLDNALSLVMTGGFLVVITPAIWTLHNFPVDCNRLLPNFYEEYAKKRDCILLREYFTYVGYGSVSQFLGKTGEYQFPLPSPKKAFKHWWSRIVHRAFYTYGRGMSFPSHIAVGAVFKRI